MAGSVTEAWSHDESSGGRSVTGMHGSVMGNHKSVTGVGGMEMQQVGTEVYQGYGFISSWFTRMYVFLGMGS